MQTCKLVAQTILNDLQREADEYNLTVSFCEGKTAQDMGFVRFNQAILMLQECKQFELYQEAARLAERTQYGYDKYN
jgi:hypothetical protein